jgi:hypothetical protein
MENPAQKARLDLLEELLDEIDHERFAPTDDGDAVCLFCGAVSPEESEEQHQVGCTFGSERWDAYRASVSRVEGVKPEHGPPIA